ncbi:MAG: type IV pilus twitching motility protein PilT, partial [Acidobacteriota bacterium]
MEQLNQYLKTLLSSDGYELHLEPNKNPYVVAASGSSDVANTPLQGTQISMMVFPLIPPDLKQDLPNLPTIQFVHPHNLGRFSFTIHKSPAGFNVTVRPMLGTEIESTIDMPSAAPGASTASEDSHRQDANIFGVESSSIGRDINVSAPTGIPIVSDLLVENKASVPAIEFDAVPKIEVVSANDPQFQTVFSDISDYEAPGRLQDFEVGTDTFTSQFEQSAKEENPAAPQQRQMPTNVPSDIVLPSVDRRRTDRRKKNLMMTARMDALFNRMAEVGASDLHLAVSVPPMVRRDGKMQVLECNETELTAEVMDELLQSIMPERNRDEFEKRSDTDFAYEIPGLARFRSNIFMDRKGMGAVFRIIPSKILTAEELGLSKAMMDLCSLSKGLVVVTGPTGSGKSTTLCAMVDSINRSREDHIITIEDPIEFVHDNHKCLVNQREVHSHTDSFKDALRAALREDPDIVLVGEMRDLETIAIAIETAETGHLVFGTLHTTTAPSTVDRIIDQFPADRQQQIRVMLSESLKGVISQTLLPKKGGGRVAALEILIITPAISNLIREGKTFQIPSAMQTGKNHGMVMLN